MTQGWNRNNPGNLRGQYHGAVGNQGGFAVYDSPEAGVRAIDRQLALYLARGVDTPAEIVSTWAPPSENDTRRYLRNVAGWTGLAPDQRVTAENIPAIRKAIIRMETGTTSPGQVENAASSFDKEAFLKEQLGKLPSRQDAADQGWSNDNVPGMVAPGNIKKLFDRPVLNNADGSVSTTRSMSIQTDAGEVLIPTVVDGKSLTQQEAIDHFRKTREHLGIFKDAASADRYAEGLHNEQARRMGLGGPTTATRTQEGQKGGFNKEEFLRGQIEQLRSKMAPAEAPIPAAAQSAPAAQKSPQEAPGFMDAVMGAIPFSDEASAAGAATGSLIARQLGLPETEKLSALRAGMVGNPKAGTWSGEYEAALENERKKQAATTTGQDIGAAILTAPLVAGGAAVKALSKGAQLAKGLVTGAGIGGLYGFAGGEGGGKERLEGAGVGAATGAGVAAAAPLVGAVLGGIAKKSVAPRAEVAAAKKAQAVMGRAGTAAEDVATRMGAAPGITTAEAIGEPGERVARAVAGTPGESGKLAADVLSARSSGAGGRVMDTARKALGSGDAYQAFDDLIAKRAADSAPAYAKAMSVEPKVDDHLARMIADPIAQKGMARGIEIQRLEATARNESPGPETAMRTLDAIKSGLDDIVETYRDPVTRRLNLDRQGRAVNEFRAAFVNKMDAANPEYAKARASWAGPSKSMDDISAGLDFMRMNKHDTAKAFSAAADKDMFRLGVVRSIEEKIGGIARGNSVVSRMADVPNFEDKIRSVFPKDKADGMIEMLKSEKKMKGFANYVLGGSRTAPMQQDIADITGANLDTVGITDLLNAAKLNQGAMVKTGARIANRWKAGGNERMRNELGKLLFSNDPDQLRAAMALIEKDAAARRLGASNLAGGLSVVAPAATVSVTQRR